MDFRELTSVTVRWLHVVSGILWIGLLYWFNFVNGPFAGTMDGDTKKKVMPEMLPRALYWFRWAAAYSAVTGLLLLIFVFYLGGLMFDQGVDWSGGSYLVLALIVLTFPIYDLIAKSGVGKDIRMMGVFGLVWTALMLYLMVHVGHFGYRAYLIHSGVMFGGIMAANVWQRIWPGQQKVIAAIKEGAAPDAAIVAQVGQRSRHNTYLSVPLVWAMLNMHTVASPLGSSDLFGVLPHWGNFLIVMVVGWLVVSLAYDKAAKVKGF